MTGLNFGHEADPAIHDSIRSHAFWPSISIAEFKNTMRVDETPSLPRIEGILITAITEANRQLVSFRQMQQAKGYMQLVDVPCDDEINDESLLVLNYRQAVFHYGMSRLLETYADYAATAKGENQASGKLEQALTYKREAHACIAFIKGSLRVDAELL